MTTGAQTFNDRYNYIEYVKQFHITDLNCNGLEDSVFDCSHNIVQQHNCNNDEDARVQCKGMYASDMACFHYS